MSGLTRSYCTGEKIETRAGADPNTRIMFGHASVYNKRSKPIYGWFEEIMRPGCFDNALRSNEVTCSFWQHDERYLLATTVNQSLRMQSDNRGLYQETDLLGDTTDSRNMIAHLDAKRINAMSFAFRATRDGEKWSVVDKVEIREVFEVERLKDVSPVTFPAYDGTDLGIRADAGGILNWERFARLMLRAEHHLTMSKSDLDDLKEFRAVLEKIEQEVARNQEKGQETKPVLITAAEARSKFSNLFPNA